MLTAFEGLLAADRILPGDVSDDYTHDEALGVDDGSAADPLVEKQSRGILR